MSIIIPCYNNEDFVGEAIESALVQTWRDVEVIVVDDGSSDRSAEVISGYSDRVRCVRQRQKGPPQHETTVCRWRVESSSSFWMLMMSYYRTL